MSKPTVKVTRTLGSGRNVGLLSPTIMLHRGHADRPFRTGAGSSGMCGGRGEETEGPADAAGSRAVGASPTKPGCGGSGFISVKPCQAQELRPLPVAMSAFSTPHPRKESQPCFPF